MTREEIRRLVGGYATGSLTEAERKLLFEAALDDQELFDELNREQSLKELLEVPGARRRLIAALGSDELPPVKSWWAWVAAFAMSVVAIVGVYELRHQPEVKEVATVQKPASPEVAQPVAIPPPPARQDVPTQAPKTPAPTSARQRVRTEEPVASPSPAAAAQNAPGPPPPPPPVQPALATAEKDLQDAKEEALKKTEAARAQDAVSRLDQTQPQVAQQGQVQGFAQGVAPVPQAAAAARGGGGRGGRGAAGGGRGGGGPAGGAFRANAVVGALGRFAVDYSITPEGLRIVPASAGYLSVGANTNPTIFPTRLVSAGTPILIPIPADASTLSIGFSATSTAPGMPAARREETSGTLVDQNPPSQQILVTIPAK